MVVEGEVILRKMRPKKKYELAEFVARTPRNYRGAEDAFGAPAGKEVW